MEQRERMTELRKLARTQLMSLERLNGTGLQSLEEKSKKWSDRMKRVWK